MVRSIIVSLGVVLLCPAVADAQYVQRRSCLVGVRVVGASKSDSAGQLGRAQMSPALAQLRSQLARLPFSKFVAADYQEKRLGLREPGTFSLKGSRNEQHLFRVVPHAVMGGRVQATIDWKGGDGRTVLSTKMGFINGQNHPFVADQSATQSTVISVKFSCE